MKVLLLFHVYQRCVQSGVIQILESSTIWNKSKCSDLLGWVIWVDLTVVAWDLIWKYLRIWFFFHRKSQRLFSPVTLLNNVIVSVFALCYCLCWGPNALTEALVISILARFCGKKNFWPFTLPTLSSLTGFLLQGKSNVIMFGKEARVAHGKL